MILLNPKAPLVFGMVMIGLMGGYLVMFHAMPGSLAGPHAEVIMGSGLGTCPQCHTDRGLSPGCLACHQEIDQQLITARGYHALLLEEGHRECASCHPDHLGPDFPLVSVLSWQGRDPNHFQHDHVSFTLTGAHDRLACDACHAAPGAKPLTLPGFPSFPRVSTYLGLTQDCIDCHEDVHAGGLARECTRCHGQQQWRPAALFRHDDYFVLEGSHIQAECSGCHLPGALEDPNAPATADEDLAFHRVRGKGCSDCHESPHRAELASTCTACHLAADTAWADGVRGMTPDIHAAAGFVLDAVHAQVTCDQCHGPDLVYEERYPDPNSPNYGRREDRCESCHVDPHGGQFGDRTPRCLDCHARDRFTPAQFGLSEHAEAFPLAGAHAPAACQACHAVDPKTGVRQFVAVPRTCEGCHEDPHDHQFEGRNLLCQDCHDETRFKPSQFDVARHASAYALTGMHAAVACDQCHAIPVSPQVRRFVSTSRLCRNCHQDPHGPQFQTDILKEDCAACHAEDASTFAIRPYDHRQRTGYPLTDAHARAQCNDCHREQRPDASSVSTVAFRVYRETPTACHSCHADRHRGQFRQQGVTLCDRCHGSTAQWNAERFDHNRDSRYALEGVHADLACLACHPSVRQPDGQDVIQYRPLGTQCEDCHGFVPEL